MQQEASIFSAEEKDLETVNTLKRASGLIAKEMNGGAARLGTDQQGYPID